MNTVRPALIARLYRAIEENRMSDAVMLLSQVFSFYGKSRENRDSFFLSELIRIADDYVSQGQNLIAEEHFKLALALYEAFFTEHHTQGIAAARRLCEVLHESGRESEVERVLNWAYVIIQRYDASIKGGTYKAVHAINWHKIFIDEHSERKTATADGESCSSPVRVLLVEDNIDDADLLRDQLEATPSQCFVEQVDELKAAMQKAMDGNVDVILLDLGLPDSQSIDTFYRLNTSVPHIPIIILTGLDDRNTAIRAIKQGAHDYLVKGRDRGHAIVQSIMDALDRKNAHRNRNSHNFTAARAVETAMANAPTGFAFADTKGIITSVNESWCKFNGTAPSHYVGHPVHMVLPSITAAKYQELLKGATFTIEDLPAANNPIHGTLDAWSVSSPDNGVIGVLFSAHMARSNDGHHTPKADLSKPGKNFVRGH